MLVTGVKLRNFRSYKDQAFEFEPGVNIIVGPNASGKTNLLEAVYLAGIGKSFRVGDKELITHRQPWARVDLVQEKGQRTVKLRRQGPVGKEFELGGKTRRRLGAKEKIPLVLFTPEDLRGLSGSPQRRRRLLDGMVAKEYAEGSITIGRFQRALTQRNHLLKQANPDKDELFVWGVRLGELGGQLAEMRQQVARKLNRRASRTYTELTGKKHKVRFSYVSELGGGAKYRHKLDQHLQSPRDMKIGFTTRGPHRDDLLAEIDGHDSLSTASRGELRTLVLVAKIIEITIVEQKAKTKPLLLLDDVFSELDGSRRRQLSQRLSGYQAVITTTDADAVVDYFSKDNHNLIALV